MFALSLSFGVIRKPMFWLGLALLAINLACMIFGFYLRVRITGWAPVTGMYETVIYVPLFVSLLAAWFTVLPIVWPGVKAAWRLTAIPGTWKLRGWRACALAGERSPTKIGWLLVLVRLAIMAFVAWLLAFLRRRGRRAHYRESAARRRCRSDAAGREQSDRVAGRHVRVCADDLAAAPANCDGRVEPDYGAAIRNGRGTAAG